MDSVIYRTCKLVMFMSCRRDTFTMYLVNMNLVKRIGNMVDSVFGLQRNCFNILNTT